MTEKEFLQGLWFSVCFTAILYLMLIIGGM